MTLMAGVTLTQLMKVYPNGVTAVRDLSLEIASGELFVLLGASGCGKTTLLRLIAGLATPTAGSIQIGGRDVTRLPPHDRHVVLGFQTPALYPHLTVRGNLVFHERLGYNLLRRWWFRPSVELQRRVDEVSGLLGLEGLLDHRPAELSGGERQRVALGRALIRQSAVFLLDEPLAHVDQPQRRRIRRAVRDLQHRRQMTLVWVTHDPTEAVELADRIGVMHQGRLVQVDRVETLRRQPANELVAELVSGAKNG